MIVTVFDTETTGFEPSDRVIELAWAEFCTVERQITRCMSAVLKSGAKNKAEDINAITPAMIASGAEPGMFQAAFKRSLERSQYVLAHNASFDVRMMQQTGMEWPEGCQVVCTLNDIDWSSLVGKNTSKKLTHLALDLGVVISGAHRAIVDVITLCACLAKVPDLERQLERSQIPPVILIAKVTFEQKEAAKQAGFAWNPSWKSWEKVIKPLDGEELESIRKDFPFETVIRK